MEKSAKKSNSIIWMLNFTILGPVFKITWILFWKSTHRVDAPDPVEPRDDGVDGAGAAPRLATADLGPGQPEVGPEEAGQAEVGGDRGRVD